MVIESRMCLRLPFCDCSILGYKYEHRYTHDAGEKPPAEFSHTKSASPLGNTDSFEGVGATHLHHVSELQNT